MSTNKFTIELKADESNFNEIANSVRGLAAALKEAGPELETIKRSLESLRAIATISTDFAGFTKAVEKTEDAMLQVERATRNAARAAEDLDEQLNGARITAGALADNLATVGRASARMADSVSLATDALDDAAEQSARAGSELDDLRVGDFT
jgi:chromosome segregation ATPase